VEWWVAAGAVTAVLLGAMRITRAVARAARATVHAVDLLERLRDVPERLGRIEYELKPNDGRSMRDAIDTIGLQLNEHLRDVESQRLEGINAET